MSDLYRLLWRRHRPMCTIPGYIRIINVNRSGLPFPLPWCGEMCQVKKWQLSRKVTQSKFISQRANGTAKRKTKKQQDLKKIYCKSQTNIGCQSKASTGFIWKSMAVCSTLILFCCPISECIFETHSVQDLRLCSLFDLMRKVKGCVKDFCST